MIEHIRCVSGEVIHVNRENVLDCKHRMGFESAPNVELNEFRCQSCGEVLSELAMKTAISEIER